MHFTSVQFSLKCCLHVNRSLAMSNENLQSQQELVFGQLLEAWVQGSVTARHVGGFNMAADFELGNCKLLRSNINYLHQSLQIRGKNAENVGSGEFVWTDGENVWLSPVNFKSNDGKTIFTSKERCLVGKFENFVFGISSSVLTKGSSGYFIAIIFKEKIVILWRTIGENVVKLVKEYSTVCLPQGCVWHPTVPLLAVLSKTSAVLLCFSEEFECNVISIQTSHRNLQTCSWSKDGKSLASAVEDSLCIFSWTDLTKPNKFTFAHWKSLEVTGKINCIAPWQTSSFIVVTELPLDKLCGSYKFENDADIFEVQNGCDSSDEGNGKESSNSSTVLTQDTDFSILTPSTDQDLNSLLKLKLRTPQFEASETLAQIIAIHCEDLKPSEVCRSSIKGLISPDLLLFQPATSTVIVGSHCCSRLHFFTLHQSNMNGKTEFAKSNNLMELDPATKPKGICLIPGHTNSLLALLGKAKDISNMIAFPPSAVCEQFEVSVRCLNVLIDEDHRKTNGQRISQEDVVTLTNGGNNICAVVTNSEHSPSLRLPDGSIFKGCLEGAGSNKTSLISELTLNEVPELLNSKKVLQGAQSISFKHIQDMEVTMATFVSEINDRLSLLEKRMDKIDPSWLVENKHTHYPSPENAEFVCVVWTDELTGAVEQQNFLLDKGRLKLKTIQQAFSASLVRMCIGDVPCIVSSGEGGFIPVRFLSGSTVHMSGHSKL